MAYKGKAIYNPKGKAGEYSEWACNFFTGCSNDCDYCYCKRGVLSHVWTDKPRLKKCFSSEEDALRVFVKEMFANIEELREKGVFFTFTSDPMLEETKGATIAAMLSAVNNDVPVQLLTKRADLKSLFCAISDLPENKRKLIAVGFTLTGHDELEPGASKNADRIAAMRKFKSLGCHTFASIEPIVTLDASDWCISESRKYCDLFKIGLMSGGKKPDKAELAGFVNKWNTCFDKDGVRVYWKESVTSYLGDIVDYPIDCCVGPDFNIFKRL